MPEECGKSVAEPDQINTTYRVLTWIEMIKKYILEGKLPEDRKEAKKLRISLHAT